MQNLWESSGPASRAQLQPHFLWQLPGAASAFWELPLSHYELQKQHHGKGHEKTIRATLMVSLGALQYKCTNGSCTATIPLQRLHTHLSLCKGAPASLPNIHIPLRITLWQVLDAPANSTPSTAERRVLGHLTQRMMASSSVYGTDSTITVPTGGQAYTTGTKPHNNYFYTIFSEYT